MIHKVLAQTRFDAIEQSIPVGGDEIAAERVDLSERTRRLEQILCHCIDGATERIEHGRARQNDIFDGTKPLASRGRESPCRPLCRLQNNVQVRQQLRLDCRCAFVLHRRQSHARTNGRFESGRRKLPMSSANWCASCASAHERSQ